MDLSLRGRRKQGGPIYKAIRSCDNPLNQMYVDFIISSVLTGVKIAWENKIKTVRTEDSRVYSPGVVASVNWSPSPAAMEMAFLPTPSS